MQSLPCQINIRFIAFQSQYFQNFIQYLTDNPDSLWANHKYDMVLLCVEQLLSGSIKIVVLYPLSTYNHYKVVTVDRKGLKAVQIYEFVLPSNNQFMPCREEVTILLCFLLWLDYQFEMIDLQSISTHLQSFFSYVLVLTLRTKTLQNNIICSLSVKLNLPFWIFNCCNYETDIIQKLEDWNI